MVESRNKGIAEEALVEVSQTIKLLEKRGIGNGSEPWKKLQHISGLLDTLIKNL